LLGGIGFYRVDDLLRMIARWVHQSLSCTVPHIRLLGHPIFGDLKER